MPSPLATLALLFAKSNSAGLTRFRSISSKHRLISLSSNGANSSSPPPLFPALAVRPSLWMYCSFSVKPT